MVSIDSVDMFEQKEMKKTRPIKNTWYDWLINYIPESIGKSVCGFKYKIVSLFKPSQPKQAVFGRGKKLSKTKRQNIRNSFLLKKKIREIKERIIKDIQTHFESENERKTERNYRKKLIRD